MAYFENIDTEEELRSRFRELLRKYNYDNPRRDDEAIDEVFQEYQVKLRKIMCSKGYKTPYERARELVKKLLRESNAIKKERIRKVMENKDEKLTKRLATAYIIHKTWDHRTHDCALDRQQGEQEKAEE